MRLLFTIALALLVVNVLWAVGKPPAISESRLGTLVVVVAGPDAMALVDPAHPDVVRKFQFGFLKRAEGYREYCNA
jgi:hypothetical protein